MSSVCLRNFGLTHILEHIGCCCPLDNHFGSLLARTLQIEDEYPEDIGCNNFLNTNTGILCNFHTLQMKEPNNSLSPNLFE